MRESKVVGQRYGRLVVVEGAGCHKTNTQYLCQCDCGNLRQVSASNIARTLSCGCIRNERSGKPVRVW